jgi:hypothetical protein
MFRTVALTGRQGSLSWGYRPAADLRAFTVSRDEARAWYLRARLATVDQYRIKQVPLIFTAPRTSTPRGLWTFPVLPNTVRMAGSVLTAALGPPEGR